MNSDLTPSAPHAADQPSVEPSSGVLTAPATPAGEPASTRTGGSAPPEGRWLEGRVVLVTGAGQGLGRAVAEAAGKAGATVVLLGRHVKKLEATYDAIEAAGGAQPAIFPLDLNAAQDADFNALAQALQMQLKRLDAVVHCAAHFQSLTLLENHSLEHVQTLLRVNLMAPLALTRACLPLLKQAPDGTVIFTGESHAGQAAAYWGALALAKGALPELAAMWQAESERFPNLRFHTVVPGPMHSPQRDKTHPGETKDRLPSTATVAAAYLDVLRPEGQARRGQTIRL